MQQATISEQAGPIELTRATTFLEERFHRAFEEELGRFEDLLGKLVRRWESSSLHAVDEAFLELARRLRNHVLSREQDLFPRLRRGLRVGLAERREMERSADAVRADVDRLVSRLSRACSGSHVVERALLAGLETFSRELDAYFALELALPVDRPAS